MMPGPLAGDLQLDRPRAFALRRLRKQNVVDFYDDDEIRRVYYPEMETLIEHATGASKVMVFDHTIRVDDEEKQIRLKVARSLLGSMHNDFTVRSAPQRVRDFAPGPLRPRHGLKIDTPRSTCGGRSSTRSRPNPW